MMKSNTAATRLRFVASLFILLHASSTVVRAFARDARSVNTKSLKHRSTALKQNLNNHKEDGPFSRPSRLVSIPSSLFSSPSGPKPAASTALKQSSVAYPVDEYAPDGTYRTSPVDRMGRAIQNGMAQAGDFLERRPFVSAISITTVNAVVADLMTQLVFSKAAPWNPARTLMFGLFGFFYQGMVQYLIVNGVWEKVFPGTSAKAVVSKICAMNLLTDPMFFMPTFYIFQEVMTSAGTPGIGFLSIVKTALLSYKSNCLMDWRNSWMVWFPGHAVTYGVMPSHKRIPWMAFLSFFYMCILSITRGV